MAKFTSNHAVSGFIVPVLILVVLAGGYFMILPKYRESKVQKQVLAEKEQLLNSRQQQISQIDDLIAELNNKQEELSQLDLAVPSAPRIPELLANLEFIGQQSGLLVSNISLSLVPEFTSSGAGVTPDQASARLARLITTSSNLGVIKADMTLNGGYENFKAFLEQVEHNLRLFDILDVVLNAGDGSSDQEYSVQILTYYQR